jgi:hypothetical protein
MRLSENLSYLTTSLPAPLIASAFVASSRLGKVIFALFLSVSLLVNIYAVSWDRRFVAIGGELLFRFMELLEPGSLVGTSSSVPPELLIGSMGPDIYYSSTCTTTLGFDGLPPATPRAPVFSHLAVVAGQIFLTVLIDRTSGLHITRREAR